MKNKTPQAPSMAPLEWDIDLSLPPLEWDIDSGGFDAAVAELTRPFEEYTAAMEASFTAAIADLFPDNEAERK